MTVHTITLIVYFAALGVCALIADYRLLTGKGKVHDCSEHEHEDHL